MKNTIYIILFFGILSCKKDDVNSLNNSSTYSYELNIENQIQKWNGREINNKGGLSENEIIIGFGSPTKDNFSVIVTTNLNNIGSQKFDKTTLEKYSVNVIDNKNEKSYHSSLGECIVEITKFDKINKLIEGKITGYLGGMEISANGINMVTKEIECKFSLYLYIEK